MAYVFGPVPSRRLGRSLGIDVIPSKTCNWNCVYCQLGRTHPFSCERRQYFPTEDIAAEVRNALSGSRPDEIDWVTFVGSGEPTLHSDIGHLIRVAKAASHVPVAVITNGSLLSEPGVRQALAAADAVMPTLDAGTADLFRRINRPHPSFAFDRHVEGLVEFRREYDGRLWVEVMLLQGLNDTEAALKEIAEAMKPVAPDEIHIGLPERPPVEEWAHPSDQAGVLRAAAILGDVAHVLSPVAGTFELGGHGDPVEAVLQIITRHPMRQDQLEQALEKWAPGRVEEVMEQLTRSGRAQVIERHGVRFWSAASSRYSPKRSHEERGPATEGPPQPSHTG